MFSLLLQSPDVTGQSSCEATALRVAASLPAGVSPRAITAADFDLDGAPDLAVAGTVGVITLYRGYGDGDFAAPMTMQVGGTPSGLAVEDFNHDGWPDLAVADQQQDAGLLINQGGGSFAAPVYYEAGTGVTGIVAADFDGDGMIDLVAGGIFSNDISLLRGKGDGTFEAAVRIASINSPRNIIVADFNSDNRPDLTTNGFTLLNAGNGAFGEPVQIGFNSVATAAGDLNGDGKIDLAISSFSQLRLIFGDGAGKFSGASLCCERGGSSGAIRDLTGDGKPDLVVAFESEQSARVSVLAGDGAGTLTPVGDFGAGRTPVSLAVADFNKDGRPDLATANRDTDDVSVLINTGNGDYRAARITRLGGFTTSLSAADIDRDGRTDLVLTASPGQILIASGMANGEFGPPKEINTPGNAVHGSQIADFTGDGHPDLAVTYTTLNETGARLLMLINAGGEIVSLGITSPVGRAPHALTSSRLDTDEHADLVVASRASNLVSLIFGNGLGGISRTKDLLIEGGPCGIAVGDFDADGRADLAVALADARALLYLYGDGSGEFPRQLRVDLPAQPQSLRAAELDAEGSPDLIITFENTNQVLIRYGKTLTPTLVGIDVGFPVRDTEVGDFNGDGLPDLLAIKGTEEFSRHQAVLLRNDGFGGLLRSSEFVIANALHAANGDFNGDGRLDLAAFCTGLGTGGAVWMLAGECAPTRPLTNVSAASFGRDAVASGAIVAAFGRGLTGGTSAAVGAPLPTSLGGAQIRIRDAQARDHFAPLFFVSPGQINYILPDTVAPGPAIILATNADGLVFRDEVVVRRVGPGVFAANAEGSGVAAALILRLAEGGGETYASVAVLDPASHRFIPMPIELGGQGERVFLVLFGTGWRGRSALSAVSVEVGGVALPALFAGAQGDFIGLDQLNVELPVALAGRGEVDLRVVVDGVPANIVRLAIR